VAAPSTQSADASVAIVAAVWVRLFIFVSSQGSADSLGRRASDALVGAWLEKVQTRPCFGQHPHLAQQ
jgi:hypothetical protein